MFWLVLYCCDNDGINVNVNRPIIIFFGGGGDDALRIVSSCRVFFKIKNIWKWNNFKKSIFFSWFHGFCKTSTDSIFFFQITFLVFVWQLVKKNMSCRKKNLDKMYYLKKNNFTAYTNQKKKETRSEWRRIMSWYRHLSSNRWLFISESTKWMLILADKRTWYF